MKIAVLTMDIEDWYHLDYFDRRECNLSYSLLDGLDVYASFLSDRGLQSTFFALGELAETLGGQLKGLAKAGHEISSHGWDHKRPLGMTSDEFRFDLLQSRAALESVTGQRVAGYRAPCFSMDRSRLDQVEEAGFDYDSSRIEFGQHPLYGTIDMAGYDSPASFVFQRRRFFEFEVSTLPLLGRRLPVSGGGYLRLIPWPIMRTAVGRFLDFESLYVIYLHPFELSAKDCPLVPSSTSRLTRFRFAHGREYVLSRLGQLVDLLSERGYSFTTFGALHSDLVGRPLETPL